MNRIYRSIYNPQTGAVVAAPENAKSVGKTSSTGASSVASVRFVPRALAVSVALAFATNGYALPTDGVVSAGSASISGGAGTTTITQTSQNAAINWQSFSIGQGEAVQFVQPNSSAVALNRVLGSDPSSILGSLSANGKVFLLNANGILFGKGAQVNVGGLVASTLNLNDSDFMAGNYKFTGAGNGTIRNQGSINADGGYVALLGANVSNEGVISARLGTVALAAGDAITLDVAGDGLLNVTVDQSAVNALVQNSGLIQADGGQVLLTAQAAGDLLQGVVNNTGVIRAQTVENRNGSIRLLANMQSGTVNVGGTLDVSGTGAGQTGGSVTATGHHVGLFGGQIDASGNAGGGTVLIGGGYQGKNPDVQNASATYMSSDSTINADAITNGNGGTVVLWANDSTRAYGSITARGGAQGGDGGLIETSAYWFDVFGLKTNASAPNGKAGTWLLDPADVTIGGTVTRGATPIGNVFTPDSGVSSANVTVADLRAALQAGTGTDVIITTTNTGAPGSGAGDITVAEALTWVNTSGDSTLTLSAAGDVNINAAITADRGSLVVCCGQDVNVNAAITTTNGSVLLSAGRDVNILRTLLNPGAAITTTNGNIELCAARNINLNNALNPGIAPLITLTGGSTTGGQDLATLGVPLGLTLRAGTGGTGPGTVGGTVIFTNGGLGGTYITTTAGGPGTPINIFYNPVNYSTPTDYSFNFTGDGGPLTQYMLVFPDGASKAFDGDTAASFTGFKGNPAGVTFDRLGTATFDTADVGTGKTVTFRGFTLAPVTILPGGTATNFALPVSCCAPIVGRTTADITPVTITPVTPVTPVPAEIVQTVPVIPTFTPTPVLAATNLGVEGIRMPPIEVVPPTPVQPTPVERIVEPTPEVLTPPPPPPPPYVPPKRPRKADRS